MEQLLIVQMIQKLGKILFPSGNKPVFSLIENKCLTVNVHRKPNKKNHINQKQIVDLGI